MTSGGYRSVSSAATVARFRKHVSPLTGVVSRLERIEADLPLNTNYFAAHNFSAPARSVNELRTGLRNGSFGKGSTAEQGEASALMEAIERYSGIFQGDEIRVTRRFTDFPVGDAIFPNDVLLFSETQLASEQSGRAAALDPRTLFDPSAEIEWSPVWSLRDRRFKYLPTSILYFFHEARASSSRTRTAARPAIRSRKPSCRASSSWWRGMHTQSGGTIAYSEPKSTSANSTIPMSGNYDTTRRNRPPAVGA